MATRVRARESLVMNWTAKGAILLGALGAVVGLVVGVLDDRGFRVAVFATFELGTPAFILGGIIGAVGGAAVLGIRTLRHDLAHESS